MKQSVAYYNISQNRFNLKRSLYTPKILLLIPRVTLIVKNYLNFGIYRIEFEHIADGYKALDPILYLN